MLVFAGWVWALLHEQKQAAASKVGLEKGRSIQRSNIRSGRSHLAFREDGLDKVDECMGFGARPSSRWEKPPKGRSAGVSSRQAPL
jgi:hypothetical protein